VLRQSCLCATVKNTQPQMLAARFDIDQKELAECRFSKLV
jgi:hypothetical protein